MAITKPCILQKGTVHCNILGPLVFLGYFTNKVLMVFRQYVFTNGNHNFNIDGYLQDQPALQFVQYSVCLGFGICSLEGIFAEV